MRSVPLTLVLALLAPAVPAASAATASMAAASAGTAEPATTAQATDVARKPMPRLKIKRVIRNVDHPWDVRSLPGGSLLFTQRDRATLSVLKNGKVRRVRFPSSSVWVSGETGLMGLAVDPDFANNRRIYTCQGGFTGNGHDVHVTAWTLNQRLRRVTIDKVLVNVLSNF